MENVKKFYNALASDMEMQDRLKGLNSEKLEDEESALALLIEFAAQEGYFFTTDQVKNYINDKTSRELDDDDLEAVTGGSQKCVCAMVGMPIYHNGKKSNSSCSCIVAGSGAGCGCFFYGSG